MGHSLVQKKSKKFPAGLGRHVLRTCFSSIKINSEDLLLYNTGMKETLFSRELARQVSSRQMWQSGAFAPGLPIAPTAHFQQEILTDSP